MALNLQGISPLSKSVVEFLHELSCHAKVDRLIIFGSRACNDYDKYSDIDLAIDAESFNREDWIRLRMTAYYDVRTVLQISIVNFVSNPSRLQNRILEDGLIIYDGQKKVIR
ncbi:nucleotidyltransferase family protein [Oceanicoccus sp. KOV_DT_Chl]|uniref:nucleotidyltransferase family protein n=1 Tax=Oceanicoccus sp. KOV_DT_Chl TaxID=1904639 RepID=UPI000C7987CD